MTAPPIKVAASKLVIRYIRRETNGHRYAYTRDYRADGILLEEVEHILPSGRVKWSKKAWFRHYFNSQTILDVKVDYENWGWRIIEYNPRMKGEETHHEEPALPGSEKYL